MGSTILACAFGLLTTTFICVNNLRDRSTDREVGKMTLATRLSPRAYKTFILFTIFTPYLLLGYFWKLPFISLVFLALFPAVKLAFIILKSDGVQLNEGLKFSGIHLVCYSLFLSFVFIYENIY
jgi:1,4-dihydroxy-2-naphthoate octaprenyltransferase